MPAQYRTDLVYCCQPSSTYLEPISVAASLHSPVGPGSLHRTVSQRHGELRPFVWPCLQGDYVSFRQFNDTKVDKPFPG